MFSEQSIMDELQGVRTNFRVNLVITILLAIIGIIILLWINYRPIYNMISEFGEEERFSIVMSIFREYVTDTVQQETAFSYLELLTRAQTKEEMKACFCNLLQFQIGVVSRQQIKEGKGIVSKVMNYVQDNYMDCNLNLNSVAEGLGKNPRYISRTFKEETKIGIIDYINSVRIEKAKELMASRMYSTQEVAERVGYTNVRTFRRAFEKITGEMPGNRKR